MYTPVYTNQFAKDVKKARKRGKNLDKFKVIAETLILGQSLDEVYREHKLVGNYVGRKECHIEPDWLLIYKIEETQMVFERMGTHSDLFK